MSTLEHPDGDAAPSEPAAAAPPTAAEKSEPEGALVAPPSTSGAGDPDADPAAQRELVGPEAGSTLEQPEETDPLDADEIAVVPDQVRRAPRYGRFATVGGLLALALAFLLAPFARYDEPGMVLDPWGLSLLLAAIFTPFGILLGCAVALVADRRSRREK